MERLTPFAKIFFLIISSSKIFAYLFAKITIMYYTQLLVGKIKNPEFHAML